MGRFFAKVVFFYLCSLLLLTVLCSSVWNRVDAPVGLRLALHATYDVSLWEGIFVERLAAFDGGYVAGEQLVSSCSIAHSSVLAR